MSYPIPTTLPSLAIAYPPAPITDAQAIDMRYPASPSTVGDSSNIFLQTINQLIEREIDNTALGIRELMAAVHLSHSQLFRRLKELTGKSPTDYIRSVRLQKALRLLYATQNNVSEIAYSLGFTDPNYFSRAFRREFGQSPRAVRQSFQAC